MIDDSPKDAFQITESKSGKSFWTKIGAAFVNKDGSINVFLDAFPKDGKIQIRNRKSVPKKTPGGAGGN